MMRQDFSAFRINQTLAAAIVEHEAGVAFCLFQQFPLVIVFFLFDLVAVPQAGRARQR